MTSLAGSRFALGETDVMLGGLEGLEPSLHVLLEDLFVLSLLCILGDEVAAAASFVLAMTAHPAVRLGALASHRNPRPQPQHVHHRSCQPSFSRISHGLKNKIKTYKRIAA